MTRLVDLSGRRFGMLLVVGRSSNSRAGKVRWQCICDCGVSTIVGGHDLRSGHSVSCGCYRLSVMRTMLTTHGESGTDLYRIWGLMKSRCQSQTNPKFNRYGGRGIEVCERWSQSFDAFRDDVGPRPSRRHSINRIDNDGHYEPGNVEWALPKAQARNTSKTRYVRVNGKVGKLIEMADALGIKYDTLKQRARRGSFGVSFVSAPTTQ